MKGVDRKLLDNCCRSTFDPSRNVHCGRDSCAKQAQVIVAGLQLLGIP